MGNTISGEYPGTWELPEVKKWQSVARNMQQCTYLQFGGSQFHDITDLSSALRITKICYAMYGPPSEATEDLERAYRGPGRDFGCLIYEKIKEVWKKAPEQRFKLGFLFVYCKEGDKEFQVPLFRLLWETKDGVDFCRYIDTNRRVYDSAKDWKDNNHMPMMKYCHPKFFFYTCDSGSKYKFDPDEEVAVDYNTSPACDLTARITRSADVIITTVGMAAGVAAIFTPAGFISGPILLSVGLSSAGWGVNRATQRLIDKATHGESLTDLESAMIWLSLAATPLHLLNGYVGAKLAAGAAGGRIFTQSQRLLATLLIWTAVGIDSFSYVVNLTSMIDKAIKHQLTALDVFQFSVSTLFFGNMLIQPKTANGIIKRAQNQRIQEIANKMTDADAKVAFKKYLEVNRYKGRLENMATIVRDLNRLEDPNAFFKTVNLDQLGIGVNYSEKIQSGTPKIQKPAKLRECLGGIDYKDHKHLGQLSDQDVGRLNKVIGGAIKYEKKAVIVANQVADAMQLTNNPGAYMSILEIVGVEMKKDPNFFNTVNARELAAVILKELDVVKEIGKQSQLTFSDDLKGLYHGRKHGEEFTPVYSLKFYLGKLPEQILEGGQLAEVCKVTSDLPTGGTQEFLKKVYVRDDNAMLALIEMEGLQTISTMFKKPNCWNDYIQRLPEMKYPPPDANFAHLAFVAGLDAVQLQLRCCSVLFENDNNYTTEAFEKYQAMIGILVQDIACNLENDDSE